MKLESLSGSEWRRRRGTGEGKEEEERGKGEEEEGVTLEEEWRVS